MAKSYYNIIETLVCICSEENGRLQILLKKKQSEPYQGMWILPGSILSNDNTLENCASEIILNITGIPQTLLLQTGVLSNLDRDPDDRIIACPFLAITIKDLVDYKNTYKDTKWFDITNLPQLGYDHKKIINQSLEVLKKQIELNENDILYKLFPKSFTLPEFQTFFETTLNQKLDRRNFRKKLINENIVQETGETLAGKAGRPSKLYRLNSKI